MSEFYFLGKCCEISTEKAKIKFDDGFVILAPVETEGFLLVCFGECTESKPLSPLAEKRYFDFNGKKVDRSFSLVLPDISVSRFSKAISILYESDKKHGGGDGELNLFRHKFGKTVHLYTNDSKTVYVIKGRNLKVTQRGIER